MTALVQGGRGFISGVPDQPVLAFAVAAGMIALLGLFGWRGLRRAEAGL
jgi:hypothetical protein